MQGKTDIQQNVFAEAQKLIEELSATKNTSELISKQDLIGRLNEYISFLKISTQFGYIETEKQTETTAVPLEIVETEMASEQTEYQVEEEVIFNNELNEIADSDIDYSEPSEVLEDEAAFNNEFNKIELLEEEPSSEVFVTEEMCQEEKEAKIRLAHIKGLKKEETIPVEESAEQSLLKRNISTSYMEAEQDKPIFKLDLNDKIAFTKTLFNGNQNELESTISQLNQFKTLDEAKEYLSDQYYERNWEKSEEYAQRLWSLVENKFL